MTKRKTGGVDEIRRQIAQDGAQTAYAALIEVCEDRTAPAQARATAGVAVLRAAGMFEKIPNPDADVNEMSASELAKHVRDSAAEVEALKARIAERAKLIEAMSLDGVEVIDDDDDDLFE